MADSILAPVLNSLTLFDECIRRAIRSRAYRQSWISKAEAVYEQAKAQLDNDEVGGELDDLLKIMHKAVSEKSAADITSNTLDISESKFVEVEAHLRDLSGLDKKEYKRIVEIFRDRISAPTLETALGAIPKNGRDFAQHMILTMENSLEVARQLAHLPRKEKRVQKKLFTAKTWKNFVGGVMAIANTIVSQHIDRNVAITSMSLGVVVLGHPLPTGIARKFLSGLPPKKPSGHVTRNPKPKKTRAQRTGN